MSQVMGFPEQDVQILADKVSHTDGNIRKIIAMSKLATGRAYCPYSNYPVGAALLCKDGSMYMGCNVENASYGLCICAERTALVKAVSEGKKEFVAIAVSSMVKDDYIRPCGACRQFISEFGPDIDVYSTKPNMTYEKQTISELLPEFFSPASLQLPRI